MRPGRYDYIPQERVMFGRPAAEAVAEEAERRGAERVFVIASRSLATKTPVVDAIRGVLGARFAGLFDGCREHTPWQTVLAAAESIRQAKPDLLVAAGGGTVMDTAKLAQICLAEDAHTADDLARLHLRLDAEGRPVVPPVRPSPLRMIAVPTTLTGAEYSNMGGGRNEATGIKEAFGGPNICPATVILDPAATLYTPEWLLLSTAVRSVDHAVEAVCAVDAQPMTDALGLHALRLFAAHLPHARRADDAAATPDLLEARLACQQAVWLAATTLLKVKFGASHGIGHVVGGLCGVAHGHTSCILLPHVLRWNAPVNAGRQALVAEALGRPGDDAADAVADLVAAIGQPARLRDVSVPREALPRIAEAALQNMFVRTNPRPIERPAQVMEILEAAW